MSLSFFSTVEIGITSGSFFAVLLNSFPDGMGITQTPTLVGL